MKRWMMAAAAVLGLTSGCDNPDVAVFFTKLVGPSLEDGACRFDPGTDPASGFMFDPAVDPSFRVAAVHINQMNAPDVIVDQIDGENLERELFFAPQSFQYVFECDPSLFAGTPTVFLPIFGATDLPFCRSPRDDDALFLGFDEKVVDGGVIEENEETAVSVRVISPELRSGFVELFTLATSAEECCRAQAQVGEDLCGLQRPGEIMINSPACDVLRNELERDLQPSQLSTVREFAKFSQFASSYWRGEAVNTPEPNPAFAGGGYELGIRGNLVGRLPSGREVVATEARFVLEICGGCVDARIRSIADDEEREETRTERGCLH
ncbi:MAG TPA: hypothetical protein RMG48_02905 [Myxococcales bacterium LLY-WYZ-16_1]|nr:hypothetical protein [Myxococcales bacterium LLY-WYZ-16_1]